VGGRGGGLEERSPLGRRREEVQRYGIAKVRREVSPRVGRGKISKVFHFY